MKLTAELKDQFKLAQDQGVPFFLQEGTTRKSLSQHSCGTAYLKGPALEEIVIKVDSVLVRLFEIVGNELRPIDYSKFSNGQLLEDRIYTITIPKVFEDDKRSVAFFLEEAIASLDDETRSKYFGSTPAKSPLTPYQILKIATHVHPPEQTTEENCIACELTPTAQIISGYLFDSESQKIRTEGESSGDLCNSKADIIDRICRIFLGCACNHVSNPDLVQLLEGKLGPVTIDRCDSPYDRIMSPYLPLAMKKTFSSLAASPSPELD